MISTCSARTEKSSKFLNFFPKSQKQISCHRDIEKGKRGKISEDGILVTTDIDIDSITIYQKRGVLKK